MTSDGRDEARLVCISGGTSGIGAALVTAFLKAGDRVLTFSRDPAKCQRLTRRWPDAVASGALRLFEGSVTDGAFLAHLAERIASDPGRLDVLVNNAGVILGSGTLEETPEQWRATLEVNLIAPFALTQSCARLLELAPSPVVINISSACAQHPFSTCTSTSYSVSKAGLDMLTQRLALALGPRGIRVNAIAPGVVDSEMWGGATELMQEITARRHALRQEIVAPADVAEAALFLASAKARLITGTTLKVDAGYTLG